MRHLLFGAALLLAIAPAAIAQNDKDKPKPDKPSAAAEKELKDLNDEFNKAQNDLYKSLNDAKTPEEAQKIAEKEKLAEKQQKLMADYAKRAFAIAEKFPKEGDVAVDALIWVVNHAEGSPESIKAVDMLIRDHIANKKIDALLPRLVHMPLDANEKLIRAVLEKADTAERKANVRIQLAKFLKGKADAVEVIKSIDAETRMAVEQRLGKDFLARLAATDPAKATAEAEALFEAVVKDKTVSASIKESAEAELFELQHLAIGKPAIDIEGEDIDGKKFKLSDYKGKVVVIDFWGNW